MTYSAKFGNSFRVFVPQANESLQKFWKRMLRLSKLHSYGDVALYCDGVLIRDCWNVENKILDKKALYTVAYNKYN